MTQHRFAALENIDTFLSILYASHNDLISSLIEVGDPGLAQPSADESGSGCLPDGSPMGGVGKFGSLAASLRASWREDGRKPEIFGLDSDLRGGRETVDGGEDDGRIMASPSEWSIACRVRRFLMNELEARRHFPLAYDYVVCEAMPSLAVEAAVIQWRAWAGQI